MMLLSYALPPLFVTILGAVDGADAVCLYEYVFVVVLVGLLLCTFTVMCLIIRLVTCVCSSDCYLDELFRCRFHLYILFIYCCLLFH